MITESRQRYTRTDYRAHRRRTKAACGAGDRGEYAGRYACDDAYTVLRLAIFAVALGLLYLVGARGILLVGLAAVVSAILSFVVLARWREAMAGSISQRITNARARLDEGTKVEDVD